MAEIGGEFGVAGAFAGAQEGLGDLAILLGRKEPVAGETDNEGLGEDGGEGVFERAVGVVEIELVEGARDVEVGVGVETVDEGLALVAQVALDFELQVEVGGGGLLCEFGAQLRALFARLDRAPPEFAVHGGVGEVSNMRHHAGDGQADAGAALAGVIAVEPGRVLHDRLAADLVKGDGLSALARSGSHGEEAAGEAGEFDGEEHRGHAPHRAADDSVEFGDTEMIEEQFLRAHHVKDGEGGEAQAVGFAGGGVNRGWAGGARTTAWHIGADDEEAAGVDGFAEANEVVPPAGFFVGGVVPTRGVVVAAQGVADQNGVIAGGVERTVGFVAEGEPSELLAVFKREGVGVDEILGHNKSDLVGREVRRRGRGPGRGRGRGRGRRSGLVFVGHACSN